MYTIIDIETTGFLKRDSEGTLMNDILEFGYINVDNSFQIVNYGTLYFYEPWFNVESDAQKVHGITRQFLQQMNPDTLSNAAAMVAMLTNTTIVGKNTDGFDLPFIKAWVKKLFDNNFDIARTTEVLKMKGYNGGTVYHFDDSQSLDLQKLYGPIWRSELQDSGVAVGNKRGSLTDYIMAVPGGMDAVDSIYNELVKDRETRAHGALYDCVMTYIILLQYVIKSR